MSSSGDCVSHTSDSRVTGQVKWFNSRAGYGFITVKDGCTGDAVDVFVHHTAISVKNEQYRYLVQGEYVTMEKTSCDNHEFQAADVRGIGGGLLMCETHHENRRAAGTQSSRPTRTRTNSGDRRGRTNSTDEGWDVVRNRRNSGNGGGSSTGRRPQQKRREN